MEILLLLWKLLSPLAILILFTPVHVYPLARQLMLYNPLNTFQLIQAPLFVQIQTLSSGGSGMYLYCIQLTEQRRKEI